MCGPALICLLNQEKKRQSKQIYLRQDKFPAVFLLFSLQKASVNDKIEKSFLEGCKMKKKITAFLLCAVMVFTLSACGKQDNTDNTNAYDPDATSESALQGEASSSDAGEESVSDSNRVSVTVPEGYTLLRFSWLLEEKGVCSSDEFVKAAQGYDLNSNTLLADVKAAKDVCFNLEGYLFPATYTFSKDATPEKVIDTMVSTMSSRITGEMRDKAKALGYNMHEILTIASIIEKEAYTAEQRTAISAVLHNRLKKKMKLQCDVTTKYCTGVIQVQYPEKIDYFKYHYNTYRCDALPAGPICNPGMASINAALNPDNSDYLYFVINTEPPYESAFSATYDEHVERCTEMGYTA